jgi:hypothetical protein
MNPYVPIPHVKQQEERIFCPIAGHFIFSTPVLSKNYCILGEQSFTSERLH